MEQQWDGSCRFTVASVDEDSNEMTSDDNKE